MEIKNKAPNDHIKSPKAEEEMHKHYFDTYNGLVTWINSTWVNILKYISMNEGVRRAAYRLQMFRRERDEGGEMKRDDDDDDEEEEGGGGGSAPRRRAPMERDLVAQLSVALEAAATDKLIQDALSDAEYESIGVIAKWLHKDQSDYNWIHANEEWWEKVGKKWVDAATVSWIKKQASQRGRLLSHLYVPQYEKLGDELLKRPPKNYGNLEANMLRW